MTSIRVLLIGFGSMGRSHHRVISAHPRSSVVAIVEPQDIPVELQADVTNTVIYKTVEQALDAVRCDVAVIASSTATHFEIASRLMQMRIPTLIEKPISASITEVEELVGLAIESDVRLICTVISSPTL